MELDATPWHSSIHLRVGDPTTLKYICNGHTALFVRYAIAGFVVIKTFMVLLAIYI